MSVVANGWKVLAWDWTYGFADVVFAEEVLRAEVFFGDGLVVDNGEGADSGESEVFGYFGSQCAEGDEQDVGGADAFLGLGAPEADLAVVEGDFVGAEAGRGGGLCGGSVGRGGLFSAIGLG